MTDFVPFPKIPRLSRDVVITEKLDGSNAQVVIMPGPKYFDMEKAPPPIAVCSGASDQLDDMVVLAGSRNRYVTPEADNYNFAAWVKEHACDLVSVLGEGQHFGEWWGRGINRNYSLTEKRFSLFNTKRGGYHYDDQGRVGPCHVVPTLYRGPMEEYGVMKGLQAAMKALQVNGSFAAPGFMQPEGVVVFHEASQQMFKKTFEGDERPKGMKKLQQLGQEIEAAQ